MGPFRSSHRLSYSLLLIGVSLMLLVIVHARLQVLEVERSLEKELLPATSYVGSSVPSELHEEASHLDAQPTEDLQKAPVTLDITPLDEADSIWVYALVAPFPTVIDDVSSQMLLDYWHGSGSGPFGGAPLRMAESTLRAVAANWGEPAAGAVVIVPSEELVEVLWSESPSWGIVPFEDLEPRLKVLSIDQNSPIHGDFDQARYPIMTGFRASDGSFLLPATNRDPSKMTRVMLTGVTALVRAIASKMERKGMTYPAQDIHEVLLAPDILHINNEVPFYSLCDVPDPRQVTLVFCSREKYMELLTYIDTDVIELSGDRFADYGEPAMLETLQIYKNAGIPYYGGGANIDEARKPLLLEDHGNRIAFIGCSAKAAYVTADEVTPGAAPCDYEYMRDQIGSLRGQGYVVIATFQYEEYSDPAARPIQMEDFRRQADSGAQIVSGSQAHYAQIMEFYGDSFIHYGLGNLFFDQMGRNDGGVDGIRRQFTDEYVIYDGQYISTELHTFVLMDYSRPRLMDPAERMQFLRYYFEQSGWVVNE